MAALAWAAATGDAHGAGQSIVMTINGRQVTASSPTLTAGEIQDLMLKVGNTVVPTAQPGKSRGLKTTCTITGDASDPKVALLRVRCNDWVIDVARLCAPAPCRYEANQRMYLPPRKSR